jgi:hypothetical protein
MSTIVVSPAPTPTDPVLAQAVLHLISYLIEYRGITLILHTTNQPSQPFGAITVQYKSLEDGAAYVPLLDAAVLIAGTPFALNLLSSLICRNQLSETPLLLLGYSRTHIRWLMELLHIDELPKTIWCVDLDQPERYGDCNIDECVRANTFRLTDPLRAFLACVTTREPANQPFAH